MEKSERDLTRPWLEWAVELQSLAQSGLYYGKDVYDLSLIHISEPTRRS